MRIFPLESMKPKSKLTVARAGIQTPPDGMTDVEKSLSKVLFENTVQTIYAKLPTSRMKAIVALHFELGYTQDEVAEMFGVTQPRVKVEINNIRKILAGKKFRPHRKHNTISIHELLSVCWSISQP